VPILRRKLVWHYCLQTPPWTPSLEGRAVALISTVSKVSGRRVVCCHSTKYICSFVDNFFKTSKSSKKDKDIDTTRGTCNNWRNTTASTPSNKAVQSSLLQHRHDNTLVSSLRNTIPRSQITCSVEKCTKRQYRQTTYRGIFLIPVCRASLPQSKLHYFQLLRSCGHGSAARLVLQRIHNKSKRWSFQFVCWNKSTRRARSSAKANPVVIRSP